MALITPNWNAGTKCLLSHLPEDQIQAIEDKYADAKCSCLAFLIGSGAISVIKEAGKGVIIYAGRRWLGAAFITNATKSGEVCVSQLRWMLQTQLRAFH